MQTIHHSNGFPEKRQYFRRKMEKIADNCDYIIDLWREIIAKNMKAKFYSWARI
jgi:hypothetical protein